MDDDDLDLEASLARLQEAMGRLTDTLEELGAASIRACDSATRLLEDLNTAIEARGTWTTDSEQTHLH